MVSLPNPDDESRHSKLSKYFTGPPAAWAFSADRGPAWPFLHCVLRSSTALHRPSWAQDVPAGMALGWARTLVAQRIEQLPPKFSTDAQVRRRGRRRGARAAAAW